MKQKKLYKDRGGNLLELTDEEYRARPFNSKLSLLGLVKKKKLKIKRIRNITNKGDD
jgi:hypothetical protein